MEKPSISIIIPCKNEIKNIRPAVERIPNMGSYTEIIFCDDKSTDGTRYEILKMIETYPDKRIRLIDGPGICKADNVWNGLDNATGDILCILDGDLTVQPEILPLFYNTIRFHPNGFINGTRFVYPMKSNAMLLTNKFGNKFLALLMSFVIKQKLTDTLCGTKVFWRSDYYYIRKHRNSWGVKDQWGDYELLLSAVRCELIIAEIPVYYMDRVYGNTKMNNRIIDGLAMLWMCITAWRKL